MREQESIGREGPKTLREIVIHSVSAIGDQGLFAISNFVVNIILARQMSRTAFGQFSAAFAAFILISPVYCAFVIDPMLIFGMSTASGFQKSYVRRVVSLQWYVALALSLSLLGVGVVRSQMTAEGGAFLAYIGWAIAAPVVFRLWLARRTSYLVHKPYCAAVAGGLYLIIIAALMYCLSSFLERNVILACLAIAFASIVATLCLHRFILLTDAHTIHISTAIVLQEHWKFGRWASIAGVLALLPDNLYFFVLSPVDCAGYRALINVTMPLLQLYSALGVVMLSYFARYRTRADFFRIALRTGAGLCAAAILLAIIVVAVGGKLFGLLYAGKYDLRSSLLWPLAAVTVLFAVRTVSDAILRSLENVAAMTTIAAIGALAAVVIGAPLAKRFGVRGAVYGNLLAYLIAMVPLTVVWLRRTKMTLRGSPSD